VNTEGSTTEERQLADMLRRVTPEPPRRVSVEDVAFRLANQGAPGRARRRGSAGRGWAWNRSWAPVLAAASVFVVAGGSAGAVIGLASHHGSTPTGGQLNSSPPPTSAPASSVSPTQVPTTAGPTFAPERVAGGLWGAELINRQIINSDSLVGGANSLYAIADGHLDRINPATGQVVAAAPYNEPTPNPPVVVGSTVWEVSSYAGSGVVLQAYDGQTLAQVASVTLPVSGQLSTTAEGVLTSGPDGSLYVAAGSSVAVVNPATRQVIKRINVSGGPVNSVAVSPDGGRLYVSTGSVELTTYDLATGAPLGSSAMTGLSSVGGNLIATSGGVWGTVGVGMTEWVWFAPDANLTQVVRVSQGAGAGLDSVPTVSGGTLWIGGSHTLECANPDTGQKLAAAAIPTDGGVVEYFGSVTMTGGHAYAYYQDQRVNLAGVATLTPPSACSG
jgi:YVTN family beta-propeller protein